MIFWDFQWLLLQYINDLYIALIYFLPLFFLYIYIYIYIVYLNIIVEKRYTLFIGSFNIKSEENNSDTYLIIFITKKRENLIILFIKILQFHLRVPREKNFATHADLSLIYFSGLWDTVAFNITPQPDKRYCLTRRASPWHSAPRQNAITHQH